jgi:hypothetical protein
MKPVEFRVCSTCTHWDWNGYKDGEIVQNMHRFQCDILCWVKGSPTDCNDTCVWWEEAS